MTMFLAVFRIRIRVCWPLGSGSFHQQAKTRKKKLDFYCFVTSSWLSIFKEWFKFQKWKSIKIGEKIINCWHLEGHWRKELDPDPIIKVGLQHGTVQSTTLLLISLAYSFTCNIIVINGLDFSTSFTGTKKWQNQHHDATNVNKRSSTPVS